MQEGCEDYYECELDEGCCLKCSESYDGCLCFECKCTKCYWYCPPEEYDGEKGHCDKTEDLIEEGKRKAREYYKKLDKKKAREYRKWYKNNFKSKIDNKKNTIKPNKFLDEEIKKDILREKRRLKKDGVKRIN